METQDSDLIYGTPAIAAFLHLKDRQAYHLIDKGILPSFKLGNKRCARKSTLARWLEEQEAAAMAKRPSCTHG
jgi:excisionase family DNA binding protein